MSWFNTEKKDKRYKLKDINTFSWDQSTVSRKKFRKLFDRNELNYVSVQLEFYNKLFDEKDWKTKVGFKAYTLVDDKKTKEHCATSEEHEIKKDQNIVKLEFGWGNEKYGSFWKKGAYRWEVFIDDELVGSTDFYVEDAGRVTTESNPYFEVVSLKTYEAPEGDLKIEERRYLRSFNKKLSRYIMGELKFRSKLSTGFFCELHFIFYDDTGLLVGKVNSYAYIEPTKENMDHMITAGWGSAKGNSWLKDNYSLEVVFMDTVVAMIPFSVGEKDVDRNEVSEALLNQDVSNFFRLAKTQTNSDNSFDVTQKDKADQDLPEVDTRSLEEILADLDALIGLQSIKSQINKYIDYVKFVQYRKDKGIQGADDEINLHSVFMGNPGTGKTTVVQLLGGIYKELGLLSKGHVLTVNSNEIIASYVRQTAEKTKKFIEKARGGILFIDEAYMLYKEDSPNDFGPEAITVLLTEMSDGPGDIAIMLAGYPKEMDKFVNSNPGLKSRIRNYYHFNDYTPDELVAIGAYAADKKGIELTKAAKDKLHKIVTEAYRNRDENFGNARLVNAILEEAKMNLGIRIVRDYDLDKVDKKLLSTIDVEDISYASPSESTSQLNFDIDQYLLKEAMDELNQLIGLENIKQEVNELVKLTQYYRESKRNVLQAFSLHAVFLGNPGTGKTTIARIMGKIYKALGLLERGHVVEADSSQLIAGYVGQTAIKTKELIKSAMGGILFIDEAYAITDASSGGKSNDFGKEAIAALIKEMEDHRGKFGVIVAGYTDNMKGFLEANPGIKSRFDRTFHFKDFTQDELWEIAVLMFKQKGLKVDKEATQHLLTYIKALHQNKNKFFGNARSVRKIVEKAFRNQELRMANLANAKRTRIAMETLTLDDVQEFDVDKIDMGGRKKIGF